MAPGSAGDIYAETMAVFDRVGDPHEPLTTPEVADALDANRRTVYKRLRTLVDRDALATKAVGSNARVWWRPPSGTTDGVGARGLPDQSCQETVRQLQAILDTVQAVIFVKDTAGRYLVMNQNCRDLLGIDDETDVVGLTDADLFPEAAADRFQADDERVLQAAETVEVEEQVPTPHGTRTYLTRKTPILDETGEPSAICAVATDISDRRNRERELERYETIVDTARDVFWMFTADFSEVLFINSQYEAIWGQSTAAIEDDPVAFLQAVHPADRDLMRSKMNAISNGESVDFEVRVNPHDEFGRWVWIQGEPLYDEHGDQWGVAGFSRDVTGRKEREQELEYQREQLAALNHLNDIVRDITEAAVEQSTRAEIEQVVCDRLAAFDPYQFAWTCAVDPSTQSVELRAEATVEGSLETVQLPIDLTDPPDNDPVERAVLTQEMQVTQTVRENAESEQWREHAREHGYRSSATIPITYEGITYGVIGVTSERPDAFAAGERRVVEQLGEVVGHAIAAVDRKRALMSDEVVELEFRMHDVEALGLPTSENGRVVFDRTVPIGDGCYLEYGTATDGMLDAVQTLVDTEMTPHVGPLTVIERTDDEIRFEIALEDPPLLSTVTGHGGYFDEVRIEDQQYSIRVHVPPSTGVRRIVETVTEAYPQTELVTRQQTSRSDPILRELSATLTEELTERQRAALEAGYFAGFFEWPRDCSGEDVADSLGISPSTFHQHLRRAEKKLLDTVFEVL